MNRKFAPLAGLCLVVLASACTAQSEQTDGDNGATTVQASGGAIGASCVGGEVIACAPGNKNKVRCKGGAWLDDGACKSGDSCVETKATDGSGKIIAADCRAPSVSNLNVAAVCARFDHCYSGDGVEECVSRVNAASQWTQFHSNFKLVMDVSRNAVLALPSRQACVLAAKDCAAVSACLVADVPKIDCTGSQSRGCAGTVAYLCVNKLPLALDCALFGLPCRELSPGKPACSAAPNCTGAEKEVKTCLGTQAKVCREIKGDKVGYLFDCAAFGMTCQPEIKDDDPDVCGQADAPKCDKSTYTNTCEDNVLVACNKGRVVRTDCSQFGEFCAIEGKGDEADAFCSTTYQCPKDKDGYSLPPSCNGDVLTFCDSTGRVSFNCAQFGMKCDNKASFVSAGCTF